MKSRTIRLIAMKSMAALILLSIPTVSHAQSSSMQANVPFDFYIGGTTFPAGTYTIKSEGASNRIVNLTDEKGRHQSLVMTIPSQNRGNNRGALLVFHRYEGTHFLSEVRWLGAADARVLPMSPLEVQMAKGTAAEQVATGTRNR